MGAAKRRGSYEERVAAAKARAGKKVADELRCGPFLRKEAMYPLVKGKP